MLQSPIFCMNMSPNACYSGVASFIAMNWYGHWGQVTPLLFTNDLTVGSDGIRPYGLFTQFLKY
jgi:hypothetical protein